MQALQSNTESPGMASLHLRRLLKAIAPHAVQHQRLLFQQQQDHAAYSAAIPPLTSSCAYHQKLLLRHDIGIQQPQRHSRLYPPCQPDSAVPHVSPARPASSPAHPLSTWSTPYARLRTVASDPYQLSHTTTFWLALRKCPVREMCDLHHTLISLGKGGLQRVVRPHGGAGSDPGGV